MDVQAINARITQLCHEKGWSYYKLAKEAGFQQSTLKSITKEKNMPSLYTIVRICAAFNITISEFFDAEQFSSNPVSKQSFISLWNRLQPDDQERVLIYMHGLLHQNIEKDFNNELY